MGGAYYNEIDKFAAEWLRNLIKAGEIAPGDVDERDIRDVTPSELMGYRQCHFFAGIGGWSRALRLAEWGDDRPVWTGSCPCQSFSAAGRGLGFADERHLWPSWFHLIRECRPSVIFGEQVASKLALSWLDLVFNDLEAEGYACGAADLCAASVGAPHIRQRLWFVAYASDLRCSPEYGLPGRPREGSAHGNPERYSGGVCAERSVQGGQDILTLADALSPRIGGGGERGLGEGRVEVGEQEDRAGVADESGDGCEDAGTVGHAGDPGLPLCKRQTVVGEGRGEEGGAVEQSGGASFWHPCEWLPCRDGKYRPTKPGLQPLASRIPGRVGQLRAAGNSIVPEVGAEFIKASNNHFI